MKKFTTYNVTPKDIEKKWYLIDAAGQKLGKVAARAAIILRGKDKPIYTPYLDTGDNVVIINVDKIVMSGNKGEDKLYYNHSGFPGGLKIVNYNELFGKNPIKPLEHAIKGMLPKGPLGRQMLRNLKVYRGADHPHMGQHPKVLDVASMNSKNVKRS